MLDIGRQLPYNSFPTTLLIMQTNMLRHPLTPAGVPSLLFPCSLPNVAGVTDAQSSPAPGPMAPAAQPACYGRLHPLSFGHKKSTYTHTQQGWKTLYGANACACRTYRWSPQHHYSVDNNCQCGLQRMQQCDNCVGSGPVPSLLTVQTVKVKLPLYKWVLPAIVQI